MVREDEDRLVIGSGVPESWMGEAFSVTNWPTYFGNVSFEYDPSERALRVTVERMPAGGVHSELPGVGVRIDVING